MTLLQEAINLIVVNKQIDDSIVTAVKAKVTELLNSGSLKLVSEPNEPESLAIDQRTISLTARDAITKVVLGNWKKINHEGFLPSIRLIYAKLSPTSDGEYDTDENVITIATRLIARIGVTIAQRLREVLNTQSQLSDSQLVNRIFSTANVDQTVRAVYSVIAHELVHAQQALRTPMYSYRSYITRNAERFYAELDAATTVLPKSYFGSPEEIGAYAHQHALMLIRKLKESKPKEALDVLNSILTKITVYHTGYKQFQGSPDKTEQNIIKRYYKKIYLDLDQYREHLKAQTK